MPMALPNGAFSTQLPTLQLVIDSTSLGTFKECPKKYYYSIIEGWVPKRESPHLTFGLLFHEGCERYEHQKARGYDHEQALRAALKHVLTKSFNPYTGKPWDSGHSEKNRDTLLRTLVWYLDDFGRNDKLQTFMLKNGKPAVELTFNYNPKDFENGEILRSSVTGEEIAFSGHIDRMVWEQGQKFVLDHKTTGNQLGQKYFSQYTPHNQISMYSLAAMYEFEVDVAGVIIDAAQVKVTLSRFERQTIYRSLPQLREWLNDAKYWIALMGYMAEQKRWPQNDTACNSYGGCPYREVCKRPPGARQQWLELEYIKRIWDPSVARGE